MNIDAAKDIIDDWIGIRMAGIPDDVLEKALLAAFCWQPIETAPKDGSNFLVWDSYYGIRIGCHYRRADHDDWLSYRNAHNSSSKGGFRATHWMPLPEPPK